MCGRSVVSWDLETNLAEIPNQVSLLPGNSEQGSRPVMQAVSGSHAAKGARALLRVARSDATYFCCMDSMVLVTVSNLTSPKSISARFLKKEGI